MLSVCRFAGLPVCRFAFIITVVGASFRSDDRERADSPRWVEAMRAFFSRGQARSSYSHVRRLASTARPQLSSVDANALLGDDEVKQFRRDGAICVRQVFDAAWVAALREAADVNMASPGPLCDEHAEAQGTTGRFHDDQFLWRRHAAFEQFVWRSGAGALAARAMGSRSAHIFYDQLLVKEPGTVAATPWHNDTSYWQLRGSMICSVWVALDDVAAANGVSYVRGSHLDAIRHPITNFSGNDDSERNNYAARQDEFEARGDGALTMLPDIDAKAAAGELELLQWDMQAGDAIVFDSAALHGAQGNPDGARRRRGYATRWCGDDVRFDARPGTMHTGWQAAGFDCGLIDGAKISCALHPNVLGPAHEAL